LYNLKNIILSVQYVRKQTTSPQGYKIGIDSEYIIIMNVIAIITA